MDSYVFPCIVCDCLEGDVCSADSFGRKVTDIARCPFSPASREKPDLGRWVVKQPDGLLCYYDEKDGRIIKKDLSLQEMILFRERECRMSYEQAEQDTINQMRHQPVRWEDIPNQTG